MAYITAKELEEASQDAGTLDKFANDAAGVPNINRVGNDVENMMTLRLRMLEAAADVANRKVYLTEGEMLADMSQPLNTPARVETGSGAGDYIMTSTGWVWSDVQPANSETVTQLRTDMEQSDDEISGRVTSNEKKLDPVIIFDHPDYAWLLAQRLSPTSSQYTVLAGLRKADGAFYAPLIDGPGVVRPVPDIPGWARVVYSDTNPPRALYGVTTQGQIYETINGEFVKIYDPADSAGGQSAPELQGLQAMIARCMNPFQDMVGVGIGDSIFWGSGSTDPGPTSPRDHRLSDVRANLTCRSWINRFREYLGQRYLNLPIGALPTEETAPGAPAGGSGSYSAPVFGAFAHSPHVTVFGQDGNAINPSYVDTATPALAAQAVSIPVGGYFEFDVNAASFDLVYGTSLTASAEFSVYVDGALLTTVSAYNATPAWGMVQSLTMPAYRISRVRIVNTSGAGALSFEGVSRTKTIRLVNQGISGTASFAWIPEPVNTGGRILLTGAFPENTTDIIVGLGTNDRLAPKDPANSTGYRRDMGLIVEWLKITFPKASIQLVGGYATLDEDTFDGSKVFGQRDIPPVLFDLARQYGVSALNLYPQMRAGMDAGGNYFAPDNLHPNDEGYGKIFEILRNYAEDGTTR